MTGARVSVVLLTYNCAHRIERVVRELLALDVPILVVDNCSRDGTADVVAEMLAGRAASELIRMPSNLGAAARNIGLAHARTRYVAFCDDDGWYERDGLEIAADALDRHPRLALVNARILVTDDEHLDPISAEMSESPLPDRHGIPGAVLLGFMAGACVVRASAYKQVGGYEEIYFMGGEEETLALKLARAGWQMRYRPDVVMQHRPSIENAARMRAHGLRNALWTSWLHRRAGNAVRASVDLLIERPKNRDWVRGLVMAFGGLRWVLRARRPVDEELDRDLRTLDRHRRERRQRLAEHHRRLAGMNRGVAEAGVGSGERAPSRCPTSGAKVFDQPGQFLVAGVPGTQHGRRVDRREQPAPAGGQLRRPVE
jgi:glycosyltransferase involved in cell wall biosynthesis